MKFTFGIITAGNNLNTLQIIFDSIYSQIPIDSFQIVLVGGEAIEYPNLLHVPFDESQKRMWITKKKNLITNNAIYDNIVYMHDYYILCNGWYEGFQKFGEDWEVCMNIILNADNTRFRDWCAWDDPINCFHENRSTPILPNYTYNKKEFMYISGGYWIAKKNIMNRYTLNENLSWGESEDVEWSKRVLPNVDYKMNINSISKTLKMKPVILPLKLNVI